MDLIKQLLALEQDAAGSNPVWVDQSQSPADISAAPQGAFLLVQVGAKCT